MAKKARKRQVQKTERKTNWYLIGGVIAVGFIGLIILMVASMNGAGAVASEAELNTKLLTFCENNPDNCMVNGSEDAPVTVIEISDYGCGHCRNFNLDKADALTAQYVDTGQVRWIVMPFALQNQSGALPTGPTAVAAFCSAEQDRFFDFHHTMFELQGGPQFNNEDGWTSAASDLGMDTAAFQSCLADNDYADQLLRNVSIIQSAGVRSTPTFFIDGRKVEGNLPKLSDFQQIIEAALNS